MRWSLEGQRLACRRVGTDQKLDRKFVVSSEQKKSTTIHFHTLLIKQLSKNNTCQKHTCSEMNHRNPKTRSSSWEQPQMEGGGKQQVAILLRIKGGGGEGGRH